MPRYLYRCRECEVVFQTNHSIKERLTDCEECETAGSLRRIPSMTRTLTKNTNEEGRSTGNLVKQYIEDAKQDLKEEKKELSSQVYKDD